MEKKKFYISTAIAYTSAKPHIGNTYEIVLADVIARYKRLLGYDVYFQTGTDEHGEKIEIKAKDAGVTPLEYVDNIAASIKAIWDVMNTSYDKFVRTTDPKHMKVVQDIFKKFYDQGDIYKGEYKGLYCTPCESFWTESQLVDGKCPDCGREVKEAREEAYFFRMSKYAKWLEEYIESHPGFIEPEARKNEIMNNFIKPGLQDLCVSRTSFDWGIPVTFDEGHIVYVWIDALSNYITFLGYQVNGESSLEFKKYWPCDIHLIGKDILRFHTIYWPIMLHALGLDLPKRIFGHPWLLFGNDKMSKSKGNIVYADDLVSKYGVDAVRYYMIHEMPFASDGTFTFELLINSINTNLANNLGNLVNRTTSMINKYFDGVVVNKNVNEDIDKDLKDIVLSAKDRVNDKMDNLRIADSLDEVFEIFKRCNKYIDETTPWILAKDESKLDRLSTVMYNLVESIRIGAVLLQAYLPDTASSIFNQINTDITSYDTIEEFGKYVSGTKVGEAKVLFQRIVEKQKKYW
jgi:methionyl-tRNA synthetase